MRDWKPGILKIISHQNDYNNGKKVGKWFIWTKQTLKEINYENNSIASVNVWEPKSKVAVNND